MLIESVHDLRSALNGPATARELADALNCTRRAVRKARANRDSGLNAVASAYMQRGWQGLTVEIPGY